MLVEIVIVFNKATCYSALNVSGYSRFLNNVTCMSNLNINGALKCKSQNFDSNATDLSSLNVSGFTSLNIIIKYIWIHNVKQQCYNNIIFKYIWIINIIK